MRASMLAGVRPAVARQICASASKTPTACRRAPCSSARSRKVVEEPPMSLAERLRLGFQRKLPVLLQTEAAECGLACLAMIASYHGHAVDVASLRRRFAVSMRGATLRSEEHTSELQSLAYLVC